MPSAKARYQGASVHVFRDRIDRRVLRRKLSSILTLDDPELKKQLIREMIHHAECAFDELNESRRDELSKSDIQAEQRDLLEDLTKTSQKLRNISLAVDRLLPVTADVLGTADALDKLIVEVQESGPAIRRQPRKLKHNEVVHSVALELAARFVSTFREYDKKVAATGSEGTQQFSEAINVLSEIGSAAGVKHSRLTWRDTLIKAINKTNG